MKLSTKAEKALQILQDWEGKYNIYNFDKLQTIQGFQKPTVADCCYLMKVKDATKKIINTQFFEIATTGEGGTYALWEYPELEGEPPVVFFGSDGHYAMIAPSMEAFAGLFALNKFLFPEIDNNKTSVWQEWRKWHPDLEELKASYTLNSAEEANDELQKKIDQYKKTYTGSFELKTFEAYMLEMNQHKNFRNWYEYLEANNKETTGEIGGNYYVKPELKTPTNSLIDLSAFIEIIDLSITDAKVITIIEALGITMQANTSDNEYVITEYEDELDLKITFSKDDKGELVFNQIATWKVCKCDYPFKITRQDAYADVVNKIGKPANYGWKYSKKTRIWRLKNKNNKNYSITIDFKNENLTEIRRFSIKSFDPKNIGVGNFEL